MKKTGLTLLFLISLFPLFAQLKIGVKAGGVLSNIAGEGIGFSSSGTRDNAKLSYLVGGVLALPIHERFGVQAELLYSKKGLRFDGFENEKVRNHYHYLSLPLLLRYRIVERLSVALGPEVSYLLGAYQRSDAFGNSDLNGFSRTYKPLDIAINLDVQYDLSDKLALGLRYNVGLYDITERIEGVIIDGELSVIDDDVYNRSVQLSLYYWLR